MVRLLDTLNNARSDPNSDTHFAFELGTLFDSIKGGEELHKETCLHLEEMDDYPLPGLVGNLEDWYSDNDFEAARDALSLFEDLITDAVDDGWFNVATQYYYRQICLKAGLAGHDPSDEISDAWVFLEDNSSMISSNFSVPVINIVLQNLDSLTADEKDEWDDLVTYLAEQKGAKQRYDRQRAFLRLLFKLRDRCNFDTEDVETRLIASYRSEANSAEANSLMQKSDILQSGVAECGQYMTASQKQEWKKEALQARISGGENELREYSLADVDVDGVDGEDTLEALHEETEELTQRVVNWFKDVKQNSGSSVYALYCLALSSDPIPDPNKIRLSTERFVFAQLFSRQVISPEAHTFSVDPSDPDKIPSNYSFIAIQRMNVLGNALYRLIEQGLLKESDFFTLFRIGNSLSPDTESYLTDSLIDAFSGNYVQSLFMSVPHLEAVFVDTLQHIGRPTYTINDDGTQQRTLGGLILESEDIIGDDYSMYLRYRYTSREGMNIRNRLSHGQLRYRKATYLESLLTLFDIIRCVIRLNISPFLMVYGIPRRTISPKSNYGKPLDLSLFTDLNKQILGYGLSEDRHKVLIIRENEHEEVTEIFVDKGRIERFIIQDHHLEPNELEQKIAELRENNPVIPGDIEYTWLDHDLILHTVIDAITELAEDESDPVEKEPLFEVLKQRGIDESTARTSFMYLEREDRIIEDDDSVMIR